MPKRDLGHRSFLVTGYKSLYAVRGKGIFFFSFFGVFKRDERKVFLDLRKEKKKLEERVEFFSVDLGFEIF